MADIDGSSVLHNVVEPGINLRLGDGVQSGGGLVQDEEGGVLVQRPGDGDLLGLAAGDIHAVLCQVLVQPGVQPIGHGVQPVAEPGVLQALLRPGPVVVCRAGHVLPQGQGQQLEVLKDHGEDAHIVVVAVLADVDAVEQNLPLGGVVQAAEQLDEGGLAAAVPAHHGQAAAHPEPDVDVAQGPLVGVRVAEGHVPELHLVLPVGALLSGQAALVHPVGDVQIFKIDLQEFPVGPDVAHGLQQHGQAPEQLGDGPHVLGDRAHAEGACPGLQAHKDVHQAGERHRHPLGQHVEQPHGPLGVAGDGGAGAEAVVPVKIGLADVLLLPVNADVGGPVPLPAHKAVKAKQAVAQAGFLGVGGPIAVAPVAEHGGGHGGQQQQADHGGGGEGVVEEGQAAACGDGGEEQADRQAHAAQNLHHRRDKGLKKGDGLANAPAGPVFVLQDLGVQVKHRLPVHVGVVQPHHLVHIDLVVQPAGTAFCVVGPAGEHALEQGAHRRTGQGEDHPPEQLVRPALS